MVPLSFTFLSVPESLPISAASWAPAGAAAASRLTRATMAGHAAVARAARTGPAPCAAMAGSRRLWLEGRFRHGLRHVFALPFRHHRGRQCVADDVGGRAAHVEELVD